LRKRRPNPLLENRPLIDLVERLGRAENELVACAFDGPLVVHASRSGKLEAAPDRQERLAKTVPVLAINSSRKATGRCTAPRCPQSGRGRLPKRSSSCRSTQPCGQRGPSGPQWSSWPS